MIDHRTRLLHENGHNQGIKSDGKKPPRLMPAVEAVGKGQDISKSQFSGELGPFVDPRKWI
jgi:hypothetical protein